MKNIYNLLIFAALLSACGAKKDGTAPKNDAENTETKNENVAKLTDAQLKNAELQIGVLGTQNIATVLKVNGKIDVPPQNMVSISTPLGGYLKTTKLLPGMHVSQGEIIATIEDQQFVQLQQDYLSVTSKLGFAQKEYQRQQELNISKATSDKVFQQAENEYRNLQIEQSGLVQKLNLLRINAKNIGIQNISKSINMYSPINGFVTKVNVNIGKYVTPSDVLFELVNPSDIHLNLKIFEKDVAKLRIGQKLFCYTNAEPSKKHPCEIILISKDISPDHTADVHCHFLDYDKNLYPGMYMNAEIELKTNASNTLPEDAIVNFEGKEYIFIAKNTQEFELAAVQTGIVENGNVEIKNAGAFANKNIVIKNAYTLLMVLKNKEDE